MTKLNLMQLLFAFLISAVLFSATSAATDLVDAIALQSLYTALNFPLQLTGWKSFGGDPCGEAWRGVSCSGTSVQSIKIDGLGLTGTLGLQLSSLLSLKDFDASFNNIHGEIPFTLPPNTTNINLAFNKLSQNIPPSLDSMKYLSSLNLSHNSLSGPIGNIFTNLQNLNELDLSYNGFSGDLPISFSYLTNIHVLYLQNNQFTGSVIFLANLPLSDLNIQNNHFSGVIPKQFETIPKLGMEGNVFVSAGVVHRPSPDIPHHNTSVDPNEHNASTTVSNAIKNYPSFEGDTHNHRWGPAAIASIVGSAVLISSFIAAAVAIHIRISHKRQLQRVEIIHSTSHHFPLNKATRAPKESSEQRPPSFPSLDIQRTIPSSHNCRTERLPRKSLSRRSRALMTVKCYSVADLQVATNSFTEDNLLGEGSLGSVYKGMFPDGKIFAVKKINMMLLSTHEEEKFLELVAKMSRLRHPNISNLLGYCMEHNHYLLVYEYVGHISLDDALHFPHEDGRSLSWNARLRIALGVARALEYLHVTFSPPIAHGNLKAANILLDDDVMPRLCDCGLAVLRPLVCVKIKASELPSGCTGYTAPEYGIPGIDKTKSDIYAFGVLLLELLSGRKPFDSSRVREQQSLMRWASTRMHDFFSLQEMVDPPIRGSYSSMALSQLADVITMCTQMEPQLRPPISEIAESLGHLIQRTSFAGRRLVDCTEVDSCGSPYRTPRSRFEPYFP